MQEHSIAEVRGIAPEQNLDPYISDVVSKKLKDFPDGAAYEKKAADMKRLTAIDSKTKNGQPFTKDDLVFLYEINSNIEGFGYQKDPRIAEIRSTRNPTEDALIVLDCRPDQIAHSQADISANTKAYIGPIFPGIFNTGIEQIYTSFPEGKIKQFEVIIGGKDKKELVAELKRQKIIISGTAQDMIDSRDFVTSKKKEQMDLMQITVSDLGFPHGASADQIYKRAEELGLELCPAETGPHLRLQHTEQPRGEYYRIAMKQIADRDGDPDVFYLGHDDDGLWLDHYDAWPDGWWGPGNQFVFRSRPSSSS